MRCATAMFLIVAAHPGDESVGAASLLFRRSDSWVAHVTDGAPRHLTGAQARGFGSREGYAAAREREALAALALAGVPAARRVALGLVDLEAALRLSALTRALRDLFDRLGPAVVVTHAYEGGHPDHDATSFATQAAAALQLAEGKRAPELVEMTSCHRGGRLELGVFLDGERAGAIVHRLDPGERERKRGLLERSRARQAALRSLPLDIERFRPAPRYDFTRPPRAGPLGYESSWGMTGGRFRDLVRYGLLELGLGIAAEPARGAAR
jgi:LmbE family N-acetylglucosaminyl deacetylase